MSVRGPEGTVIVRTSKDYRRGIPPDSPTFGCASHAKIYRYGQEPYFQESAISFANAFGSQWDDCRDITYVLFKPDAFVSRSVERTLEVLGKLDYQPIASAELRFDRYRIRELWRYEFNLARLERFDLVDEVLCAGASLLIALKDNSGCGVDASVRLSAQKGNSSILQRAPGSIRTTIGARDKTLNFIHTPDELIDMVREFGVLFEPTDRSALLESMKSYDVSHLSAQIDSIYAQYPKNSLLISELFERCGQALTDDVARYANELVENPYSVRDILSAKHALDNWDWITLVNSYLRFNHPGVRSVFSFECAE